MSDLQKAAWTEERKKHVAEFMRTQWTPERKAKQSELFRNVKPWLKATGPKSIEGKKKVSQNGWKGGHRAKLRALIKQIKAEISGK